MARISNGQPSGSEHNAGDLRVVNLEAKGPAAPYIGEICRVLGKTGNGWHIVSVDGQEVRMQTKWLSKMGGGPPAPLPDDVDVDVDVEPYGGVLGFDQNEIDLLMDRWATPPAPLTPVRMRFEADAAAATPTLAGFGAMLTPQSESAPSPLPFSPEFSPEAVVPIVQITPAVGNKLGAAAGIYDLSPSPSPAPPPTSAALAIPSPSNSSSSGLGTFTHFDQRSDDFLSRMLYITEQQLAGSRDAP
jgi:hypothetical protein